MYRIILILTSFLMILFQFEIYLRISKYQNKPLNWITQANIYRLDKELIYRIKPGIIRERKKMDQLGLLFLPPSKNTKRKIKNIFLLGDSTVKGKVDMDKSLPLYLSKELNETNSSFAVYSGGIPGYGTDQELLLFKRMMNYKKPDIVFWFLSTNDIYDNYDRPLFIIWNNRLIQIPGFINGLYLQGLILKIIPPRISANSKLVNFIATKISNVNPVRFNDKNEFITNSLNKIQLEIIEMNTLSKKNKFKLVFVLSPLKGIVDKVGNNEQNLFVLNQFKKFVGDKDFIDMNESFLRYMSQNPERKKVLGTSTVNTLFLDESKSFNIEGYHPNEFGNIVMAKTISKKVSKEYEHF